MVMIIAEAGVNHNGDLDIAKQLVKAGAQTGSDFVKFQTFKTEKLVSPKALQADYQAENMGQEKASQFDMLKALELKDEWHDILKQECAAQNICFLSTPFDISSIDFLADDMDLFTLKVGSGDMNNMPYLLHMARKDVDIIISTGMADLNEARQALGVIAFGYLHNEQEPSIKAFEEAFESDEGQELLKEKVTILHCTSKYPTPLEHVNLKAMMALKDAFGLRVGLSDHTQGIKVAPLAVALGAEVIEKHFTLSRDMEGPDHVASLEPSEMKAMNDEIRRVSAMSDEEKQAYIEAAENSELILGTGLKKPQEGEAAVASIARKSVHSAVAIKAGEVFSEENLTTLRPADGIQPINFWQLLGKTASRDYGAAELIDPSELDATSRQEVA